MAGLRDFDDTPDLYMQIANSILWYHNHYGKKPPICYISRKEWAQLVNPVDVELYGTIVKIMGVPIEQYERGTNEIQSTNKESQQASK